MAMLLSAVLITGMVSNAIPMTVLAQENEEAAQGATNPETQKTGTPEETKKELVSRLVAWAKQGGKFRTYLALAAIFVLLVYYHSIGKKMCVEWEEVYGD